MKLQPRTPWPDRYLRDVNRLLQSPGTTAMGAYAMGAVTVVAQAAEEWVKKQRPRRKGGAR